MSYFTLYYLIYPKLFSASFLKACFKKEKENLKIFSDGTSLEKESLLDHSMLNLNEVMFWPIPEVSGGKSKTFTEHVPNHWSQVNRSFQQLIRSSSFHVPNTVPGAGTQQRTEWGKSLLFWSSHSGSRK